MRLEFIHPIYLPPLTECYLRKDFNFAQYLAHAYGKTLTSFFNNGWLPLLLLTICIDFFRMIDLSEEGWSITLLNFLTPIISLAIFAIYYFYFRRIERVLHPQILLKGELIKPEEINFHINYDVIDPFALYDNIPQPEYLEIHHSDDLMHSFESSSNKKYDQDDEESMILQESSGGRRNLPRDSEMFRQEDFKDRSCCSSKLIPYSNIPNRHEKLFCCGR